MILPLALLALAQAPATATPPPAVPEKKICRRDTSTASRLDVRKTCKTAAEWAAYERMNADRQNRRQDESSASGLRGR